MEKSFGDRIKLVRHLFGLSQKGVSELAGTFIQNVSRWEKKMFEPNPQIKKRIAEALNLKLDWLITGTGFPFQTSRILLLKPQPKYFYDSLGLVSEAITNSSGGKVVHMVREDVHRFFLYLSLKESADGTILAIEAPVGHEELLYRFIKVHTNILYLGTGGVLDEHQWKQYEDSFYVAMGRLNDLEKILLTERSTVLIPTFFVELYNANKNELTRRFFTPNEYGQSSETEKERIQQFLNGFERHQNELRGVVNDWLKGGPLKRDTLSIMERYIGHAEIRDVLYVEKKFNWETDLIRTVKTDAMGPFITAYKELLQLVFAEGQGFEVLKPKLEETLQRLYWAKTS